MWRSHCLLLALAGCVDVCACFSNGKVSVACGNMVPQHGHGPSHDPPPYGLTVDRETVRPGDRLTVSLQVTSPRHFFKGFLLEVRDAGRLDSPAVGSFILTDPHQSQLLQCGHTKGSGLSHISKSKKTVVEAGWECPEDPPQKVQFIVTVVQDHKVYWGSIPGPVVSVKGAPVVPSTPGPVPTTTPTAPLSTPFSSEGCGQTKSCLRDPVGCRPELDPGCFFLSFTADGPGHSVMFELSGPAQGYVSFALSLDKWMGNDDVYLCVSDGGTVTISAGYVSGRTPPELDTEGGLWGGVWRRSDGVIQCRFHRSVLLTQQPNRFHLNGSYFLFLAHGRSHQGSIHRHDRQPLISTNQKQITGHPENLSGSRSPLLIKVHGMLMLTAWMWTVSSAVLIARHYKHAALLWFQLHRGMMVLAVGLTGLAFTLPFVYRRGWSKHAGLHPYIGCIVMALSVLQPIMAFFRPTPASPRRVLFRWMHFTAGTVGQILAVVCVSLGVSQQALLLRPPWTPAVLIGWVLWLLLTDLLLLLQSCGPRCKGDSGSADEEEPFLAPQHGQISKAKHMVLVVFLIGNTCFLLAFCIAITSV